MRGLIVKIQNNRRGSTLVDSIIAIMVIAILMTIALPPFIDKVGIARDVSAKTSVTETIKIANIIYVSSTNFPSQTNLVSEMTNDYGGFKYTSWNGSNPSSGPDTVSISRDSNSSVTVCAKSDTGNFFCARENFIGGLMISKDLPNVISVEASFLNKSFGSQAMAAGYPVNTPFRSACVGEDEVSTRNCLATTASSYQATGNSTTGWLPGVNGPASTCECGPGAKYSEFLIDETNPSLLFSLGREINGVNGVTDLSGNSNNGTAVGGFNVGKFSSGPLIGGDSGATDFDGSNDRVETSYTTRKNYVNRPLSRPGAFAGSFKYHATVTSVAGAGEAGNNYRTRMIAGPGGGDVNKNFGIFVRDSVATVPGETWTFSANILKATADGSRVGFGFRDSNGVAISYPGMNIQHGTGRKHSTATAPNNAATVEGIAYASNTSGVAGARFELDGLMLEKTSAETDFFPTANQLASGEAGWSGAAYNSYSNLGVFADGTTRTFMAWVYRDTENTEDVILGGKTGWPSPGKSPYVGISSGGHLTFNPSGESTQISSWGTIMSGKTGGWHHIAVVFDEPGNTATAYLDGQSLGSRTNSHPYANTGSFMVGAWVVGSVGPFDGKLAWVSVHNKAVTPAQIATAASS